MALDENAVIAFLYACPQGATLESLVVQFGCPKQEMQATLRELGRRGIADCFNSMDEDDNDAIRWCLHSDWKYREGYGIGMG